METIDSDGNLLAQPYQKVRSSPRAEQDIETK